MLMRFLYDYANNLTYFVANNIKSFLHNLDINKPQR